MEDVIDTKDSMPVHDLGGLQTIVEQEIVDCNSAIKTSDVK